MMRRSRAILPLLAAGLLLPALAAAGHGVPLVPAIAPTGPAPATADPASAAAVVATGAAEAALRTVELDAAVFGRSGSLRTRLARPGEAVSLPLHWPLERPARVAYRWIPILATPGGGSSGRLGPGDEAAAPLAPGIYELELGTGTAVRRFGRDHRLVVTVPFERKRNGFIGGYFMGSWPTEGQARTDRYAPPAGFIEVTRENQGLRLSEHFSLREFLTHDQGAIWPKYVVVDPLLIDKLELVLRELEAMGVPAWRIVVMSGFRTPQYNRRGLDQGRASLSRHQYGDAADVWVDNDGDWYMDDLNRDGRRDTADAAVMLEAVERVEFRHPGLIGGAGTYPDNGAHGPFIHVDVRGSRARW